MPLTEKGKKIMAGMVEEYGEEKAKEVFYASKNAGKISGVDGMNKGYGPKTKAFLDSMRLRNGEV